MTAHFSDEDRYRDEFDHFKAAFEDSHMKVAKWHASIAAEHGNLERFHFETYIRAFVVGQLVERRKDGDGTL